MFSDKHIEYESTGSENTSIEQYLGKHEPYFDNIIDKLKKTGK